MVRFGVQGRLTVAFVALVLCTVVPAAILSSDRVGGDVVEVVRGSLTRGAELLAGELDRAPPADLDGWARAAGARSHARVTVIALDGRVRADSEVAPGVLPEVENHAHRPEVVSALAGRPGSAVRHSATVGRDLLYVAVPVGQPPRAVLRLALGLHQVDATVGRVKQAIWLAGLLALGLAVLLGALLSRWLTRPLRAMSRGARAMSRGDFQVALPAPRQDELGELSRALETLRDQLAARLAELEREGDKLRAILDGMAEGVALVRAGTIAVANPAFARLFGLEGAIEGLTPLEATRLPELERAIDDALAGRTAQPREVALGSRTLALRAAALEPGPQALVMIADTTEARRLERMRRDFVANASHELRTPVAAILGAAETLASGAADDPQARASFLDILSRHAERLSRLTADLLDLARLEGGYRPRVEEVRVARAVETVVGALAPRAIDKRVELTETIDPALGVAAERAAVEQILTNLIENAIKYTPEGGRIVVRAEAEGASVRLIVEDTGPGISADHRARLFERFYRVDSARSRELGGTGLGLAIVKHLALANGGDVRVESELGRGSRFCVTLPRA